MSATFDASRLANLVEGLFDPQREPDLGVGLAFVALHRGQVVHERYGYQPESAFGPAAAVTPDSTLISWSMAKSVTHALVGLCVADGLLDPSAPATVPEWAGDGRRSITLQHLLNMRSGLHFVEDYVDGEVSHVIDMLFGAGKDDLRDIEAVQWGHKLEPVIIEAYQERTDRPVRRDGRLLRSRQYPWALAVP